MSMQPDELELGADVTPEARPKERRTTAVLSVRLPIAELKALEAASESTGKPPDQLVRDAIDAYLPTLGRRPQQPDNARGDGQTNSPGPDRSTNGAAGREQLREQFEITD